MQHTFLEICKENVTYLTISFKFFKQGLYTQNIVVNEFYFTTIPSEELKYPKEIYFSRNIIRIYFEIFASLNFVKFMFVTNINLSLIL